MDTHLVTVGLDSESVDARLVTVWASMVSMWTLVTVGLDSEQVDSCDCVGLVSMWTLFF